jgi:hypothetical protein
MGLTKLLATIAGDIWISRKCFALWPWPAVVRNYPESKLTGTDYQKLMEVLEPGDLLFTRGDLFEISNKGIPEKHTHLKHCAIYVGGAEGILRDSFITNAKPGMQYTECIIHAISEGVVCQDLFDLFRHCDEIVVVRPWNSIFEKFKIVETAFIHLGKEYDFEFTADKSAMYCTELGATCLMAAKIPLPKPIKIRNKILGLFLPFERFKGFVYVADAFVKMYPIVFKSHGI